MKLIHTNLFIFTHIIFLSSRINCNLIDVHYFHLFSNNKILIYSGQPKLLYNVVLDLTSKSTWIYKDIEIQSSTSRTIHYNALISYNNKSSFAKETEDSFYIINSTATLIPKFSIMIIHNRSQLPIREAEGVLGLSYSFSNPKYSIIHQLKRLNIINHLSFSIVNPNNITLGGISNHSIQNKYHSYCDVLGIKGNWNCKLSNVVIRNKTTSIAYSSSSEGSIVTFITNNHLNFVPKSFLELLTQEFFEEKMNKTIYKLHRVNNRSQIYTLREEDIFNGDLIFVIGDYSYLIDFEYFWDCEEGGCDLDIYENPEGDDWILGSSFLRIFNTHFDYEEKKIHFYSSNFIKVEQIDNDYPNNGTILKFILIVMIIVLLIFGLVIIKFISIELKH